MSDHGNIEPVELQIAIDDNGAAATGTLTSNNTNVSNNDTVTINSRVYTFKTTLTGAADEVLIGANADASLTNLANLINSGRAAAAAQATVTSNGTNPSNNETITIGAKTYTFKTNLSEAKATATLTSDETNPSDGETVTIGNRTYTFRSELKIRYNWIADEIQIGADADTTLANLKAAINGEAGEQTKYSPGTVAHTQVTSGNVSSHAITLTAIVPGTAANSYATTETSAHLSFGAATMQNGVASTANEVKIGASAAATLDNLKAAVNGDTAGKGVTYAYATAASTEVDATTNTDTTQLFVAKATGTAGNSLASTDTSATLLFTGSTFTGGTAASSVSAHVTAGTVDTGAHTLVVTSKVATLAANAYGTTKSAVTLSWGSSTLTGGGATIGTSAIGQAGLIKQIITKAPNWTGSPTYTVEILDASGDVTYVSGNLNENATTRTAVEQVVKADDIIRITTSLKVEDTAVNVILR